MKINVVYFAWIVAAALLGFGISAILAGYFRLPRNFYLVPYITLISFFIYRYVHFSGIQVMNLFRQNWYWGVLGGVLLAIFTVRNVLSQPVSAHSNGVTLVFDILWSGVAYGLADALFLSILPVHATWMAFSGLPLANSLGGKILIGAIAMLSSLVVTTAYHLGYPEYQGAGMFGPIVGNGAMTLGYLVTNNPLTSIISHIAMHIAGVLQGAATVTQLPPHYLP